MVIATAVRPAFAGSWQGKELIKDGTRTVSNPSHPIEAPENIRLRELWRIGGNSEEEGELFGLIRGVASDADGYVYVVDYQLSQIKLFSPEGNFVRSIGREGEGPGDIRRPDSISISSAGDLAVAMAYPSRIAFFHRSGEPVGLSSIPEHSSGSVPIIYRLAPAGDGFVIHAVIQSTRFVASIDSEGVEKTRYYQETHLADDSMPVYEERSRALFGRWDVAEDGRVYVATSFEGYELTVFAPDGDVDFLIHRAYEHRKRTPDDKRRVHDWANVNPAALLPNTRFEIEDYDKDIMGVYCAGEGAWVLTSRGFYDRPEGSLGVFDVFDGNGRFVRQLTLVGEGDPFRDRFFFFRDRLYVVTCFTSTLATMMNSDDNRFSSMCEEPMSVICYEIDL